MLDEQEAPFDARRLTDLQVEAAVYERNLRLKTKMPDMSDEDVEEDRNHLGDSGSGRSERNYLRGTMYYCSS